MNSKFIKELPELVEQDVISEDIAIKIERYYELKQTNVPNRLFTVFGVLGSLLVGLGIILILAHNWDDFSRTTKTLFAFLPLLIGQLSVAFSILKKKNNTWKEASGTFLFFTVGSSIALVSQIYNIPGDLSTYILTWILLCAPLIYLLKSNMLAILHLVFITFYAYEIGYSNYYSNETPWLYIVLIAMVVPHYIQLLRYRTNDNITSIFNWLYPLSLTIVLGTFVKDLSELGFLMYILLFSMFYNIGKIPFFDAQKLRKNGYLIFGSLGIVILMITMSFDSFWFVEVSAIHKEIPKNGDFVKAKVDWYNTNKKEVRFTFPFNEFYMEESKAYDAEVAHRDAQRDSLPNNTYALVYIKDGEAVLDNVFINDIPIADFVE